MYERLHQIGIPNYGFKKVTVYQRFAKDIVIAWLGIYATVDWLMEESAG